MKNVCVLFFILSLVFNSYSQSRTSIGLMASPDFTYVNGSFSKNNGGRTYYTIPGFSTGLTFYKNSLKISL